MYTTLYPLSMGSVKLPHGTLECERSHHPVVGKELPGLLIEGCSGACRMPGESDGARGPRRGHRRSASCATAPQPLPQPAIEAAREYLRSSLAYG